MSIIRRLKARPVWAPSATPHLFRTPTCNSPHQFVTEFRGLVRQSGTAINNGGFPFRLKTCVTRDRPRARCESIPLVMTRLWPSWSFLASHPRCTCRVLFLSSRPKITINFVTSVVSGICHFIQAWPLRLPCPSQVVMASPGGPSFAGLTSPAVTFCQAFIPRSVNSRPLTSYQPLVGVLARKIIQQQLPYVGIVALEQHHNICVILASGVL